MACNHSDRAPTRGAFSLLAAVMVAAVPISLVACDSNKSKTKTTTTQTTETPEGKQKVTETKERTVETDKK